MRLAYRPNAESTFHVFYQFLAGVDPTVRCVVICDRVIMAFISVFNVINVYYWPIRWASVILLAGVCRRRLLSSVTCRREAGRVRGRSAAVRPGAWAVGGLTVHGGPVRLRSVRATLCCQ